MKRYLIGIDTGGTYTDAVIIDAIEQRILASAKSLTTHGDLARGVSASLVSVLGATADVNPNDVQQVSLSTTLATNALVEGRGSSIAVILIGFSNDMTERTELHTAIPDAHVVNVMGGHRHDGHEQAPLDEQALREACQTLNVDAFAVASHYAVRNPAHERRATELIRDLTAKPVSASCDLSDSLNGPRRALTAAFNARIISLIVDLEQAVDASMRELGLRAPIMIVKGDGSIAAAETVFDKPIETILSGPAASVIGARYLTGLRDFVVADMGGTTTDVATVINGWPKLNPQGANVGGYHTLVKAIDMQTIGLGGDSAVDMDDTSSMSISSTRVVPISMLASLYPAVENELITALNAKSGMKAALDYLVLNARKQAVLSTKEQRFIDTLDAAGPNQTSRVVHGAADRSSMRSLLERGILRRSGFTPSDAAHVLGAQSQWSETAAVAAAELLGRASYRVSGSDVESQIKTFCQEVIDLAISKSTSLLINELAGETFDEKNLLTHSVARGDARLSNLELSFTSTLPIVAVGGPANVYYPEVGRRLNTRAHIAKHSNVANAVGAAVGMIRSEHTVEVTLNESGGYLIHAGHEPQREADASRALDRARTIAQRAVLTDLQSKGGKAGHVTIDIQRVQIPDVTDDSGLVSARITASGDSLPE